jgi:HEAT repeat protein
VSLLTGSKMKLFALAWLIPLLALAAPLPVLVSRAGAVRSEEIPLKALDPEHQYSILYSIDSLGRLGPDARVVVEVHQGEVILASKTLHAGDADYYTQFRVPRRGDATLHIRAAAASGAYTLQVNRWPLSPQVKSGPNRRWQDAMHIPLGQTVFASGDGAEYIPLPGTPRRANIEDPAGVDWYKFDFSGDNPKLVFFQVDLMERDQIPVNVSVYRIVEGRPKEYFEGEDPVTLPHEVQALPGNKFTPRLLSESGAYYIAVRANHPEYKLRTRVYDPPPYRDPRVAVRTALDYILAAGDSWHANTPRRGGVLDRVSSVHQETSLCVGCHTTHFPLRAQLYAARNGYPVVQRQQMQFLTERFYNNPRPFYGFEDEGAVWARMISAPANVLGRMSHLLDIFEEQISGERREPFHQGIAKYLGLYYAGRDTLPPDETNGNTPLVSAHEVAWYAWTATKDPRMGEFIAKGQVQNMVDLCYQTLALADIDREQYKGQIQKNAERILSLQRPDGQWSMRFDPRQPEVEFQTGHALWALQAAGVPADDPRVKKGIDYLLGRQQSFGGWMDPLQSFENFRTPFRETQMAVLALSSYFPMAERKKGWNAPPIARLSADPVELLQQLDDVWDAPSAAVRQEIEALTLSNDALLRQAAVEALGRLGAQEAGYTKLLGDASKMVQRTAAWSLRQCYSRRPEMPSPQLIAALESPDDRVRWGATRVFASHFSALAQRPEMAPALSKLIDDPAVTVRMQAIKGLWQLWFWTPDPGTKNRIEDTLLAAIAKTQPDWVESNLQDALYNLADENIRYLYNNWVPLLGRPEDRERAIRARLALESRLAEKIATVLEGSSDLQKKTLLRSLTEFPLRRADTYDLDANLSQAAPPVYNRIGNDIETVAFFGPAADRIAKALLPLLDSADPEMRRLAAQAALLVRETRFADVNRIAGPPGNDVKGLIAKLETTPQSAEVARQMKMGAVGLTGGARATGRAPAARLDEAFFRGYVEPILQKRGKDGYACVNCHATHTLFEGTWATVRNVVDTVNPENSLILRKPTSSSETEGIAGSKVLAHGGGVRFTRDSSEYATILAWIRGAKE